MKVRFIEQPNGLNLTYGRVYELLGIDKDGWYIVLNDKNEKQAYFQRRFAVVEENNENLLMKQKMEELRKIIKPIENFMNKWCCPHDLLVIQQGRAELFSGNLSIPLEIPD